MAWVRTGDNRTDLHIYPQGHFIDTARRGKMVFSGRGTCHMSFKVGDTVVYPHHGAARIEAVETRTIKGEDRTYLVLKVDKGDLTVRVPADNAELVGVRDVVGQEGLERVFEVLRAPHTEEPTNWSRRYKANLENLASGDVNKVAEGVLRGAVPCGGRRHGVPWVGCRAPPIQPGLAPQARACCVRPPPCSPTPDSWWATSPSVSSATARGSHRGGRRRRRSCPRRSAAPPAACPAPPPTDSG